MQALILKSGEIAIEKEIFILKMPVLNIIDLADIMIEHLAPKESFSPKRIEISMWIRNLEKKFLKNQ